MVLNRFFKNLETYRHALKRANGKNPTGREANDEEQLLMREGKRMGKYMTDH